MNSSVTLDCAQIKQNHLSILKIDSRLLFLFLFLFYLCLLNPQVFLENLFAQTNDIKFEHITVDQGLSQSKINCIMQDSEGYMWFGTHDGLNKFDGYNFTIYNHDPSLSFSLPDNDVIWIYEDKTGALWIGTGEGLCRLKQEDRKNGKFIRYGSLYLTSIYEDKSGTLWGVTSENGLAVIDLQKKELSNFRKFPDGLADNIVVSTFSKATNTLWIGTQKSGLFSLSIEDGQQGDLVHYLNNPDDPNSLSNNRIWSILEDRDGTIWIGTDGGGLSQLIWQENGEEKFINYRHIPSNSKSLSNNHIWTIYEDRKSNLWIGTDPGGLNIFNRAQREFIHYIHDSSNPNSISNNTVTAVFQDRNGSYWAGTKGGGINRFNMEQMKMINYTDLAKDYDNPSQVWSLNQDKIGNFWIGTSNELLQLNYDVNNNPILNSYKHRHTNQLGQNDLQIRAMVEDRFGDFWIGSLGGGICRYDREKQTCRILIMIQTIPIALPATMFTPLLKIVQANYGLGQMTAGLIHSIVKVKNSHILKIYLKDQKEGKHGF